MRQKATIEELVELYFNQKKSLSETGKIVGLTKPNVRNRLVAAGYKLRSPMNRGWTNPRLAPTLHPTIVDIAWAAGVYEGEGAVLLRSGKIQYGDSRPIVSVCQKDEWLPQRLQSLFGGGITHYRHKRGNGAGNYYFYWRLAGVRGVGFLMTIYGLLSPRRQGQIREALSLTGCLKKAA